MKKQISIALAAAMLACSLFCGCRSDETDHKNDINHDNIKYENTYIDGQDYQFQFYNNPAFSKINQAENGYYFISNNYFYYIDGKTMKTTPLCSKPNCLHDKEDDADEKQNCNAYADTSIPDAYQQLVCYGNNIYYIRKYTDEDDEQTYSEIVRVSSDGSSRETLFRFDNSNPRIPPVTHRGYLYYPISTYTVTDKKDENGNTILDYDTKIYRFDLSKNKPDPEVLIENDEFGSDGNIIINEVNAYGNYLIISYSDFSEYIDSQGNRHSIGNSEQIISVNIQDKKIVRLSDVELPEKDTRISNIRFAGGKILFNLKNADSKLTNGIYTMNFDGTDIKKVITKTDEFRNALLSSDENYIYLSIHSDDKQIIQIYDQDFKLINTASLPAKDSGSGFQPGSGDKIICWGYEDLGAETTAEGFFSYGNHIRYYVNYVEKSELLKNNAELEWKNAFSLTTGED